MAKYSVVKAKYGNYRTAVAKWEKQTGKKLEPESIKARLAQKEIEERDKIMLGGAGERIYHPLLYIYMHTNTER